MLHPLNVTHYWLIKHSIIYLFFEFFNLQVLHFSNSYTVWKNITGEVVFFWLLMNSDPKNSYPKKHEKLQTQTQKLRPVKTSDRQRILVKNKKKRIEKNFTILQKIFFLVFLFLMFCVYIVYICLLYIPN